MSVFTFAISCLTTSNLPGFMDLTFQVPMQYCSLQHWTLLTSPVTSTTGHCFCFGCLFFLAGVISLLFSSIEHTGHLPTWEVHLPVSYLFAFSYCSWGSQGKNTEVVCQSLYQWIMFCHNVKMTNLWSSILKMRIQSSLLYILYFKREAKEKI